MQRDFLCYTEMRLKISIFGRTETKRKIRRRQGYHEKICDFDSGIRSAACYLTGFGIWAALF